MIQEKWLEQIKEEILEPDLRICDAHHHLWDYPTSRYLLDELMADVGCGHNVISTVYMECGSMYRTTGADALKPVGETEFVEAVTESSASENCGDNKKICAAIVGFADLSLGNAVGAVLDAHLLASPRFRGIRHASAWDESDYVRNAHTSPPARLLGNSDFRKGFSELGKRRLRFDAWLYHPQIPELTDLAKSFPDQLIVLDHFGGPLGIGPYQGNRNEVMVRWKRDVADLAKCRNVYAKLGGLAMPINGFGWHKTARPPTSEQLAEAMRDHFLHAIDCFGPQRCMFESNFPMEKQSCSYHVLWNAFKRITAGFSEPDKAALYHDTAARVYRIEY